MIQRLGRLLAASRLPGLYSAARRSYLTYRRVRGRFEGTKMYEREWSRRPRSAVIHEHLGTMARPYRLLLVQRVAAFSPISSALEVGCSAGVNLYLLAKEFPEAELRGVDINAEAISVGRELFEQAGISNVQLSIGQADELSQFPDKAFDVVFTNALLIYVGPDKIEKVTRGLVRIARRALVLMEWHNFGSRNDDPHGLGVWQSGFWKRDYAALMGQFVAEEQIRITKIPREVWPDPGWQEWGAIVEVDVRARDEPGPTGPGQGL